MMTNFNFLLTSACVVLCLSNLNQFNYWFSSVWHNSMKQSNRNGTATYSCKKAYISMHVSNAPITLVHHFKSKSVFFCNNDLGCSTSDCSYRLDETWISKSPVSILLVGSFFQNIFPLCQVKCIFQLIPLCLCLSVCSKTPTLIHVFLSPGLPQSKPGADPGLQRPISHCYDASSLHEVAILRTAWWWGLGAAPRTWSHHSRVRTAGSEGRFNWKWFNNFRHVLNSLSLYWCMWVYCTMAATLKRRKENWRLLIPFWSISIMYPMN